MKKLRRFILFILLFACIDILILLIAVYARYSESLSVPEGNAVGFYDILLKNHDSVLTADDYILYCFNKEEQDHLQDVYTALDTSDYKRESKFPSVILEMLRTTNELFRIECYFSSSEHPEKLGPKICAVHAFQVFNQYYIRVVVIDDNSTSGVFPSAIYKVNDGEAMKTALSFCNGERTDADTGLCMPLWFYDIWIQPANPWIAVSIVGGLTAEFIVSCVFSKKTKKRKKFGNSGTGMERVDEILARLK